METTVTPEKRTLNQTLQLMRDMDDEVVALTDEEKAELGVYLMHKTDDYRKYQLAQESRIKYLETIADEIDKKIKTLKKDLNWLERYMINAMKNDGRTLMEGLLFRVKLIIKKANKTIVKRAASFDALVDFGEQFIASKTEYAWKKNEVKAWLNANPEDARFADSIELEDSEDLKWNVKG